MTDFKLKRIADSGLSKSRIEFLDNIIKEMYLKSSLKLIFGDNLNLDEIKIRCEDRAEWTINYLLQHYELSIKDIKYIAQCNISQIVIELFRLGTPIKDIIHKTELNLDQLNKIFFKYCKKFNKKSDIPIQNFYFKEFEKTQINEIKDEVIELKNIVKEMAEILKEFTGITKEKATPTPTAPVATCLYTQEEL